MNPGTQKAARGASPDRTWMRRNRLLARRQITSFDNQNVNNKRYSYFSPEKQNSVALLSGSQVKALRRNRRKAALSSS
ncbi:hypothetical protein I7I53_06872 [Histoplasma capsulatum var. duboisii H88]|uniref:Uncharacterized protein n=1 Tax=Ajellomyces capsulatus (strain H88) TaxID=544711 RepID=A0A8A1LIB0_AJEC8|nr:hypothetical protein I7I53_06872 [Histoplasma capsulatum var. duboisii H88]